MTTLNPAEAIISALGAHDGASAAELALLTGIGRSTARKFLAALEREGKTVRRPGGHEGGRRVADRWSLASTDAADTVTSQDRVDEQTADDTSGDNASTKSCATSDAVGEAVRLGRGQLADLVLDHLAEHRGDALGPSAIAKALGRSSGAVGNACERLTETGKLRRTNDAPRRYTLASS